MTPQAWHFAWRMFGRDWRSGELRLLAAALIVAVAAVSAVGFFTNRVQQALESQAAELMAADLLVETPEPPPEALITEAKQRGLLTSRTLGFPSVVMHGDLTQLVQVKAVAPGYPLRGRLLLSEGPQGTPEVAPGIPPSGRIWIEPSLLARLGVEIGGRLSLGESEFVIERLIHWEPDRGSSIFQLAPRVMLALSDLPATQLLGPGSRVRHRLLVAGEADQIQDYRAWVKDHLPRGAELEDVGNARPELRLALDQGRRFLGLAATLAVLVAGVGVAIATRRFVDRQADSSAILRCLGASRGFLLQVFGLRLLFLGLFASLIGGLLGLLAQEALTQLLGQWLDLNLPRPSLWPLAQGLGTGLLTLLGFALAPLLRLGEVPPLRVLRRDLGPAPVRFWVLLLAAIASLGGLMLWQAGDPNLAFWVLLGVVLSLVSLLLVARWLMRLLTPLRYRTQSIWRYALAALARHPHVSALQLTGFGLGLLALLLLAVVRVDLLGAWSARLPPEAPNRFLINIQPAQVEALREFLSQHGIEPAGLYPMLRARLLRINDKDVIPEDYASPRAQRLAAREFNLSWAAQPPDDNRVTEGRWWAPGYRGALEFSVEAGLADTLGIKLGDRLEYQIAGQSFSAPVTSLRTVKWDSFQPNFFVIGSPGAMDALPTTFITSFHLPPERERVQAELVAAFPSVTIMDVSAILGQVRLITDRGAMAVEYVFLFTLIAGVVVLYAGIQADRETRMQESAILRTLGLRRRQLLTATAVEFATLGGLSGLVASLAATLVGYILSVQIFDLPFHINPWLWLLGIPGGALGVTLAGLAATYPLLMTPPVEVLRKT